MKIFKSSTTCNKNHIISITTDQVRKIQSSRGHTAQKILTVNPSSQNFHKIHIKSPKIMKSLPNIHNMPIYIFASFSSQIKSNEGVCTSHDPHRLLSPPPATQIILQRSPPLPSSSWPLLKLALLPDDDRACLLLTAKHQHPLPPSSLSQTLFLSLSACEEGGRRRGRRRRGGEEEEEEEEGAKALEPPIATPDFWRRRTAACMHVFLHFFLSLSNFLRKNCAKALLPTNCKHPKRLPKTTPYNLTPSLPVNSRKPGCYILTPLKKFCPRNFQGERPRVPI